MLLHKDSFNHQRKKHVEATNVATDDLFCTGMVVKDGLTVVGTEGSGHFSGNPHRYTLEEHYALRPRLDTDNVIIDPNNLTAGEAQALFHGNRHFEIEGTNATSALVTYGTTTGGIVLTTAGADNDQMIMRPLVGFDGATTMTAWNEVNWGTENQVVWECAIVTGASVASVLIWAGLKLTNTPTIATDANQVFFRFSTDDADTTWHCIDSIAGTDTNTATVNTVAVNTPYRFKIVIDSSRIAYFYINEVLVRTTSALTNDVDLIPFFGVQALAAAAKAVTVSYQKISRIFFE